MSSIVQRITNITTPFSIYIFIASFVNKNKELFLSNFEIHDLNTRYKNNLHLNTTNLSLVQKEYYILEAEFTTVYHQVLNTLRTGDADLRFCITTVQDG